MDKLDKLAIFFLVSISLIAGGITSYYGKEYLYPPKQEQVQKPTRTLMYKHELYSCVKK